MYSISSSTVNSAKLNSTDYMSLKIRMCNVSPMRSNYLSISEMEQAFQLHLSHSQQYFSPLLPVYVKDIRFRRSGSLRNSFAFSKN